MAKRKSKKKPSKSKAVNGKPAESTEDLVKKDCADGEQEGISSCDEQLSEQR